MAKCKALTGSAVKGLITKIRKSVIKQPKNDARLETTMKVFTKQCVSRFQVVGERR